MNQTHQGMAHYPADNQRRTKNILLVILAIVGLTLIGFSVFGEQTNVTNTPENPINPSAISTSTNRMTVTGIWECLPVKDLTIPQTMECAFGVEESSSDKHYAVNTQLMSSGPVDYPTGARVKIDAVFTPVETLSSDVWKKYDIVGILSATTIQRI